MQLPTPLPNRGNDRLADLGLNKFQHTVDITFNSDEPVDIRANMIYNDANTSLPLLDLVMFSQRWKLSVILRPYRGVGGVGGDWNMRMDDETFAFAPGTWSGPLRFSGP